MSDAIEPKITAAHVRALMTTAYPPPAWALLFEVGNATGMAKCRSIDAVAMCLWPSRGLELHGFEIKVDRGDWLRERKDPAKAETAFRYFDRWSVVAPRAVVKVEEVPAPWGFVAVGEGALREVKPAPLLAAAPMDRAFLAALLRRQAAVDAKLVQALVWREVEALRKKDTERMEGQIAGATAEARAIAERLTATIEKVRAETGIDLRDWRPAEPFIAAVKMVMATGLVNVSDRLGNISNMLASAMTQLDQARAMAGRDQPTD